jgi:transcriptional antiterminator RfaH
VKQWFVVQSQPNSEPRAMRNLMRQGFEAYLPLYLKTRRHARKLDRVPRPLFPRYLFVSLDLGRDRWRSVNSTFGVSSLVMNGNAPLPVPEEVVQSVREREDAEGYVGLDPAPFHPGQRLEILDGVMTSCSGLFQQMLDSERVVLLLDMLGRQVRVTLPRMSVAVA